MRAAIVLPSSGMGIEEGTVVRWLKTVGERVEKGEPLVEIETAKAMQELEAPESGVLTKVFFAEGEIAAVNSELGLIE